MRPTVWSVNGLHFRLSPRYAGLAVATSTEAI